MKINSILFVVLLLLAGCNSYKEEKADAKEVVDGGEWIVKYTDYDENPQKGTSWISSCSVNCVSGEDGFTFRVGKKTDIYDIGEKNFCVHKSHPQYAEFVRLKREEKIKFEYSDSPVQEKCIDEMMFLKLKR